jgi:DNA-binding YbaB/EbfC family protein
MNMQAMLKQAQKLQKDMMQTQEKINESEFEGKSSAVTVKMNGKREVLDVKINLDSIDSDDVELLQDMVMVAFNDVLSKIEKEIESKMGAYTNGMPGLF